MISKLLLDVSWFVNGSTIDGFIQLFRRLTNTKLSLKTVQLQPLTLYQHHVEKISLSCIFN